MLDSFKDFFNAPFRRDNLSLYIGPKKRKKVIPNDVGIFLDFPKGIDDSEKKLIYTLWREGDVPDYNLKMLSNLKTNEFVSAVNSLLSDGKITSTQYKINPDDKPTAFYSLVLNECQKTF